jgi:hypothetical protein
MRRVGLAIVLLGAMSCNEPSHRAIVLPVAGGPHSAPLPPPPPLESVATPSAPTEPLQRWPSPARLVDQQHTQWDRWDDVPDWQRDDLARSFVVDGSGTLAAVEKDFSISVWRREPVASKWKQVLYEPWRVYQLQWQGQELRVCRNDLKVAMTASFASERAEWTWVANGCHEEDADPASAGRASSDGRWRLVVTSDDRCSGRMNVSCTHYQKSVLRGPLGASIKLDIGSTPPVLSPSGRFLAFQERDGTLSVLDTGTKQKRSLGFQRPVEMSDGARGIRAHFEYMRWLPNESALGYLFPDGTVSLYDPESATYTSGWHAMFERRYSFTLDAATGAPLVQHVDEDAPFPAPRLPSPSEGKLPDDAEKKLLLKASPRLAALGKATFALWNQDTGKPLRVLGDALAFEVSPSEAFIAVLRGACDKPIVCGASVEVIDVASGASRWVLELPEVTEATILRWIGSARREVLAVVERQGQFLRVADGAILHAEAPSSGEDKPVVLWTESGHVELPPRDMDAWVFRPAGRLDTVIDAKTLQHPGLWRDFMEGKPLPAR